MRPSCSTHIPAFCPPPFVELWQSLPSRTSIILPFVDQLIDCIVSFRARDGSELDIDTVLREAPANAIVHGSRHDPHKRVAACRCTANGELSIAIQDEGEGFQASALVDPASTENRLCTRGRGIYLMRVFMDEVRFERGGAVVCMRKAPSARPQTDGKPA